MSLKLARSGYYGGDPEKVKSASIADVLAIIEYEAFLAEYEETARIINTPKQEKGKRK